MEKGLPAALVLIAFNLAVVIFLFVNSLKQATEFRKRGVPLFPPGHGAMGGDIGGTREYPDENVLEPHHPDRHAA